MRFRSVFPPILAAVLVGCGGGSSDTADSAPAPEPETPIGFELETSVIELVEDGVANGMLEFAVEGAQYSSVSVSATSLPGKGRLWLEESGTFVYAPEADQTGADSFEVQLSSKGQTSRTFRIPIQIEPVNDAPVVEVTEGNFPPVGRSSVLSFRVVDPDSEIKDVHADLDGKSLTPMSVDDGLYRYQIQLDNQASVDFREPLVLTVSLREGNTRLEDRLHLYRSLPGKRDGAYTIMGSADKPGYDLVLLSDQYTADQLPLFHRDIDQFLQAKLHEPAINQTLGHWNLHVLFAPVEDDSISQFLIGDVCEGMCGDNELIEQTARTAFSQYDQSMVILNTEQRGGAAGVVAVTSRVDVEAVGWHELGHLYANLADEYDSRAAISEHSALSSKPQLASPPNVTFDSEPRNAPWAHWIENFDDVPGTENASSDQGVGLFLGADASAAMAYRPTFTSMMRSGSDPLGPVNSEAWILGIYPYLDIENAAYPAERTIQSEASVVFGLEGLSYSPLHRFQWRVDGVISAENALSFQCCEANGSRIVQLEVISTTPMVRLLEPENLVDTISWTLE
ncbi:M64 family metallopeptidase [Gilvimarinus xylanilyticus]|uniref:M64 family metallo-endopeptidase n=1 Tax=Gilvimarinus xylanilyticus TaxID=2944139 RepID=A0A9X2I4M9_9GAMM|nr:M64 family metallopeptidase [Gilvimarinus xylanilyticus]MCP8900608.1 M64 family metallo-endopeptidase [Gilvimarinus xylanilyticus]